MTVATPTQVAASKVCRDRAWQALSAAELTTEDALSLAEWLVVRARLGTTDPVARYRLRGVATALTGPLPKHADQPHYPHHLGRTLVPGCPECDRQAAR